MPRTRTALNAGLALLASMVLVGIGGSVASATGALGASSQSGGPSSGPSSSPDSDDDSREVFYASCSVARDAGVAPLDRGDEGYRRALDRDNDGVACEQDGSRDSDSASDSDSDSDDRDGSNGDDGSDGQDGSDGDDGSDGSDGQDGSDGSDGSSASRVTYVDYDPLPSSDGFDQVGSDDIPYGSVATG